LVVGGVMLDILCRKLKLGDFVLMLKQNNLNVYGIVIGEHSLGTCKFVYNEDGTFAVYKNSYQVIRLLEDYYVYKIENPTDIESAMYQTIKDYQLLNIRDTAKKEEEEMSNGKRVIPGDFIFYKKGKESFVCLYLGKGNLITRSGTKSGHLYVKMSGVYSFRSNELNITEDLPEDLDKIHYIYNMSCFLCKPGRFRKINRILGHVNLTHANYYYLNKSLVLEREVTSKV
jgi:hypothetical protein